MSGREPQVHKLNEAIQSFKTTLEELLATEARRSVDDALARLSKDLGEFQLSDVSVEVVLSDLTLHAAGDAPAARRGGRPAKKAPARRSPARGAASGAPRKRGRPAGGVRLALLAAFDEASGELTTDQIRDALDAAGVKTSADNLHQQLRRLVVAGELTRTGRGRYGRAATATSGS